MTAPDRTELPLAPGGPTGNAGRPTPARAWLAYLILGLAYAAGIAGWGGQWLHAIAGSAAAILLPGPALLALLGVPRGTGRDLVAGVLLSPVLLGGVVAGAALLGLNVSLSVDVAILAGALVLVVDAARSRRRPADPEDLELDALGRWPWLIGGAFAVLVAAVLLPEAYRRITSDAWFHTAVVFEIERSGLPPLDPYFAGLPLQYFWFFHAALLAFRHAAGIAPATTMTLFNILAVALTVVAAARVGRVLGFSRKGGTWAGILMLLGLGGLFWLLFPVRLATVFVGESRGWDALGRIFHIFPLTPLSPTRLTQVLGSDGFILKKYLVGTPVSWTLPLILAAAAAAMLYLRRGRRTDLALYFLTSAAAIFLHIIVGGASMAALLGGAGLAFVFGFARRRALVLAAAGTLSFAVALPYILSLTVASGSADTAFPLGLNPRYWLSLPGTLGGVLFLSWPLWKRLPRKPEHRLLLFWAVTASVYAIFANLPGGNQYDKPPIILFVPLALAAGFALPGLWARTQGRRRTLLLLFLVLFLVPENALRWSAFAFEATPPEFAHVNRDLYRWIREDTPRNAIFIDTKDRADVLVRGPRRQFWGTEAYAMHFSYSDEVLDPRRAVVAAVYGDEPVTPEELAPLGAMDGPVYVIAREADHPGIGARLLAQPDLFTPVYEGDGVRVFAVRTDRLPEP